MKKFSEFICTQRWLIVIISGILMIPALFGYLATRINYDLLVYLPSDIETLEGQEILTEEFGMGAFSARDFSSAMTQMSSAASSTIVSSSSSSSSSGGGIGGGGFSGGGGGGGGGGTW